MFREKEFKAEVLSYYLRHMVVTEEIDGHSFWWVDPEKGRRAVQARYELPDIDECAESVQARLTVLQGGQDYLDALVREAY